MKITPARVGESFVWTIWCSAGWWLSSKIGGEFVMLFALIGLAIFGGRKK